MFRAKSWRKFRRSRQITAVLAKYGLDYFIKPAKRRRESESSDLPQKMRLALEELGPTFIKLGQILSTRPDFLPPAFIVELEKLQDSVLPFDNFQAQVIIRRELNQPLSKLFRSFETEPVAAASLSQVYKAVLPDGETVAVKVQRPRIKEIIDLDLEILNDLIGFLGDNLRNGWVYHPRLILKVFKKAIEKELDFTIEAQNFEKLRFNFKDIDYVRVPKVYWHMTTPKVLTMEYIDGVKITDIVQEKYKGIFKPKEVARRGAAITLKQIFEDGFFHADPHPANIFVLPPATIAMLDAGMVGYLDDKTINYAAEFMQGIMERDLDQSIHALENLGIIIDEFDQTRLYRDLKELFDYFLGTPLKNLKIKKMNQDILEITVRHNLVLPENLVLMIKAFSVVENNGQRIDPDFNIISVAKPFINDLFLKKEFGFEELFEKGKKIFRDSVKLAEKFPRDFSDIIHKLRGGKLKFNFEHHGLEKLTREIDRAGSRISSGLIVAALIVGSSLVLREQIGPFIFGYPILGVFGYVLATFMGLGILISIFKSDDR
ncbi:MAG: AarF/ABC1/UbiB kinase family protein [Patescibacteria group bacterium]